MNQPYELVVKYLSEKRRLDIACEDQRRAANTIEEATATLAELKKRVIGNYPGKTIVHDGWVVSVGASDLTVVKAEVVAVPPGLAPR